MPSNDTLCRNGLHPWVEENKFYNRDGRPRCRGCASDRAKRFNQGRYEASGHGKWVRATRAKKQIAVDAYKAERGCQVCGEKDPVVLDLDHRDPSTKSATLRNSHGGSRSFAELGWVRLAEELEKCDVLCSNCHRRKTAKNKDRQYQRQKESTG